MAKHDVLASTENCWTALIRDLLRRLVPEAIDNRNDRIFAGSSHDVDLMKECIRHTKVVLLVVTTNDDVSGCRLSLDSATSVVQALQELRASVHQMLPRLVLLSLATPNNHLLRDMPSWARFVLLASTSHVYEDLRRTEVMLRSHADWLSVISVKPAEFSPDVARGHRLTFDKKERFISYMDLAAGMVKAADNEEGQCEDINVGFVNRARGMGAKFPHHTIVSAGVLMGLWRHFLP